MANAVIYARYSSHNQRDESIEDQVRVCRDAAGRAGDRVVRVYADRAISGTSTDKRAAFAEMVADSASGGWERVYVYKTDRFARNRYDSAMYKAKLKKNGVKVVSATESIQDGPDGILLEALLEGMAEYYSANLAQNVRRGMEGNALKCMHNGIDVFGYDRVEGGGYSVNETEAAAVREAFEAYSGGASMTEVVGLLSGYRTKRGGPITIQRVSKMLRNEKYAGVYIFKDVRVEGGMPAIVDRGLFDRVQRSLAKRMRKRRGVVDYVLSGKLFDSEGNRYHGRSGHGKSGKKYPYYRCEETRHQMPKDEIEGSVAAAVRDFLGSGDVAWEVADLVLAEQEEALVDDLAAMDAMRDRISAIGRERARLVDLAAKVGAGDDIVAKLRELEDEAASLAGELAEMERGTPVFERDQIAFWVREIAGTADPMEVVRTFVRRVVLDRARGEMRVEFSVGGPGDPDDPGSPRGCSREYLWPHSPENGRTPSSETETRGSRTYQVAGAEGFEPP